MRRFRFPIEAGHVLQFARAIGDDSPEFTSLDYVAAARAGNITAPPTFLIAADHFDPECPRRPAFGEVWPGCESVRRVGPELRGDSSRRDGRFAPVPEDDT